MIDSLYLLDNYMILWSLAVKNLPKMNQEETEKEPKLDKEGPENFQHPDPSINPQIQSDNLPIQINELSYMSLKYIKIQKNTVAKLTLSIRRETERFLYDEMQKRKTPEERLQFLGEFITSTQEKTYALREIELASCKVKENVLQEIDKLNLIDTKKYRKSEQEGNTPEITTTKIQDREDTRFSKDIQKFRKLNMTDEVILNIIGKLGCSEERGKRLLSEGK